MSGIPDTHRDLADQPIATLSTIGPDGRPQVSAIWFLIEGGKIRLSLNTARQKTKNLQANPAATLFILDPSGYRYLEIRGDAKVEPDPNYEFADRLGAKYGGADLRNMDQPGETRAVVTIDPKRVNAVDLTGAGS
jgi:PPOX class probable F420-dependent enzyme